MQPILIFRHIECEGPGYLGDFLETCHVPYEVIALDCAASIPNSIDDISGLVFMGGPMSANDALPWIEAEIDLIQKAHAAAIPILGHCLGGQLICKALGGVVSQNPIKEIGWHRVTIRNTPLAASWFASFDKPFLAFHWHGEQFSVPPGATSILSSDYCINQAFVMDHTLALQCHLEVTEAMVRQWATLYKHELIEPCDGIQTHAQMIIDLEKKIDELHTVANILYQHWLGHVQRHQCRSV